MNITGYGLPEAYTNPQNHGGATGPNLWAWVITQVGFEGTQRALFSILFGAGVILRDAKTKTVEGLTTAATVWVTAAAGIACGLGAWRSVAVAVPVALVLLVAVPWLEAKWTDQSKLE